MSKFILLDTETTGASELDRIIQLGFLVLSGKQVDVYNDFSQKGNEKNADNSLNNSVTKKAQNTPKQQERIPFSSLVKINK